VITIPLLSVYKFKLSKLDCFCTVDVSVEFQWLCTFLFGI
jgi:hypothetical protein